MTEVEICNLALSHLGIGKEIANLATERSQEANACRAFFNVCRDETLNDADWPFATKFIDLGLVEEDPTDEWGFSYRYPSDCVKFRRIISGSRNDTRDTRVPYKIGKDSDGRLIYVDKEDAAAEYTERVEDPLFFSADFVIALSFKLAGYIAPRVTAGDPFKLRQQAMELYVYEISKAQANAFNEQQDERVPESEFINARE